MKTIERFEHQGHKFEISIEDLPNGESELILKEVLLEAIEEKRKE